MLKTILVPLDGSAATIAASHFASLVARVQGATLTGLGVVDVPTIVAGSATPVGGASYKTERDHALIDDAKKKIGTFVATFDRTCTAAGVVHQTQIEEGLPYSVINRIGRSHDLIVIGRDTCFHFETSDRPGETLGRLLRDSSAPLCIVPGDVPEVKATIVAVDSATPSARTVQLFAHLRLWPDATVTVVSVDADANLARQRSDTTADYLRLHGYTATSLPIVSSERPGRSILETAAKLGAGLVVMGAHGGGAVHELFFGGTAKKVLRDSAVPVFIHH